jgi:antitoxin VapB
MHTSHSHSIVPGGLEVRSQMTGASAARLARAQQHAAPRIGISVRSAALDGWAGIFYLSIHLGTKAMPLSIKDPETERLARDLARRTGESITVATRKALQERLRRVSGKDRKPLLLADLAAIRRRCAELPALDPRTPEEIIGYDERGLPR